MSDLQNPIFTDEAAARAHLERVRWPDGPRRVTWKNDLVYCSQP